MTFFKNTSPSGGDFKNCYLDYIKHLVCKVQDISNSFSQNGRLDKFMFNF